MASSLKLVSAMNILSARYRNLLSEGWGARFADEIISKMWKKYPWRESLEELPPFHLTRMEYDYGPPLLAVPADFYALHDAVLVNAQGQTWPLTVVKDIQLSRMFGMPDAIAYQKEKGAFRVHPIPNVGGASWMVHGVYKKRLDRVTNENITSYTFPWDDVYYEVYRAGLLYKVEKEILKDRGWRDTFAQFNALLHEMAAEEGLHDGVTIIHPDMGFEDF